MPSSVSVRRSIRWLPDLPSEPTHTLVLTGAKTGVFLDVRFLKDTNKLDWAFAGYRHSTSDSEVTFEHRIDSRTKDALAVVDQGSNTALGEHLTLEVGQMINPATGKIGAYEEVWEDIAENPLSSLFITNCSGNKWQAQVGDWQVAMGRDKEGGFWAWQAARDGKDWKIIYNTDASLRQSSNLDLYLFLPEERQNLEWSEGSSINWNQDTWIIIEHEKSMSS
ncbi:hypothetical protein B0H34DRAFT_720127 [Crassisporium funariophilum]|nr:hypothetical protein B0H34DRAFT_720127 [Crassisporium funariophilum]